MEDATIWLGLSGQRFGPYTTATVLHWHRQGQLDNATLCWREGMAEWLPLATWVRERAATADDDALPLAEPPPPGLSPRPPLVAEASLPDSPLAPSFHWGWVALLSIFTFSIFLIVWMFVQSVWVKKIDRSSNATVFLVIGLICGFLGGMAPAGSPFYVGGQLVDLVLIYSAYFSMAASLRRFGAERGLPMAIGGVTLFFFTTFYLQAQLTRIAHWQRTGEVREADKGIFWAIYGVLMGLLVLLVIGLTVAHAH